MTFVSYAQNGEDVMLWRALKHIPSGFYIDVGASHPDEYSVTRAFYDRGWRGINIEPSPRFERLAGARPRDINIHAAAGSAAGELTLHLVKDAPDISTTKDDIAERHRRTGWSTRALSVSVLPLSDICAEHAPGEIHFLKIDVEGAERDVILGIDFQRFRPWIILVEATEPNDPTPTHGQWENLLIDGAYRFAWFDGLNRYYVAEEKWEELSHAFHVQPNVFDDFVRISDGDHVSRILSAEALAESLRAQLAEMSDRAAGAEAKLAAIEERAVRAEEEVGLLRDEIARQSAQIAAMTAEEETRAVQAEALTRAIQQREAQAIQRFDELEMRYHKASRALDSTQDALSTIYSSHSWRFTAPLRAISDLIRKR